jgi:acetyl-CoA acetyltransferase
MTSRADQDIAIVGIGATPYYPRGGSLPQTTNELLCKAIVAAANDAGIAVQDIDGVALYASAIAGWSETIEPGTLMETLGFRELGFTATLTGGGGGSAGAIGLAAAAIRNQDARYVVSVMGLQQADPLRRLGKVILNKSLNPESAFLTPASMPGPGHHMAMFARRHMHKYGTRREAFAEIAVMQRQYAMMHPNAVKRTPLTKEDYFAAPLIADPMCIYDFCLETDGAVAVITSSMDRARDLKQHPVRVAAAVHGAERGWGRSFQWMNMPDDLFASSGHRSLAKRVYEKAGLTPADIDVGFIYDHFTPMVVMQLEDYGFCPIGEGGPFVESGAVRMTGTLPINPHGGQLSQGYILGMTHVIEAVMQLRHTAVNQVPGAEIALVTGGPAYVPVSSLILRR